MKWNFRKNHLNREFNYTINMEFVKNFIFGEKSIGFKANVIWENLTEKQ